MSPRAYRLRICSGMIIPSSCHRVHHLFLYRLYSCGVHRDSIALVRGHPELGFQMGALILYPLERLNSKAHPKHMLP